MAGQAGFSPVGSRRIELYNSQIPPGAEPIDYQALTAEFEKVGVAGLNNGLNAEENELLFTTMHLPEMIALVLRGLGRLGEPPALASESGLARTTGNARQPRQGL